MTEMIRMLLVRLTIAGMISAVALNLAKEQAMREVVKLATGLLMILTLLQSVQQINFANIFHSSEKTFVSVSEIEEENMQTAINSIENSIARSLKTRAEQNGIKCSIIVEMQTDSEGILQIGKVCVYYNAAEKDKMNQLSKIITEECGVPLERQELIQK